MQRILFGNCTITRNLALAFALFASLSTAVAETPPIGPAGTRGVYRIEPASNSSSNGLSQFTLQLGSADQFRGRQCQWLELSATVAGGRRFRVWLLAESYPARDAAQTTRRVARYLLQEDDAAPVEFVDRFAGTAVLPATGAWEFLWPRPASGEFHDGILADSVNWLGHRYRLASATRVESASPPPQARRLELLPDVLVGVPSNTRTKDNNRRWDESDYPLVRLTREDYAEMITAGMNCFRVDPEQATWLRFEPVFYWGLGGKDVKFPEDLFRSTYLGPAIFLDEPAVHTRDFAVRPRLAKEPALRESLTPQFMFQEFTNVYHASVTEGAPFSLINSLRPVPELDLGAMNFVQANIYSWETMIAAAAWELTGEGRNGPRAIVFEPPGRIGSLRTLPEMNMAYGCQLAPENPANFAAIIFGFLRGAARAADKDWGVSIYGAVDRADAPWLLTRAYDGGATHFFFWDNYQLACVPYAECLALARHLQAHVRSRPHRDLAQLKRAAETLILIPPGYDLGHTHMGRGNLWGLTELNLERRNRAGVPYRRVMGNCFTEIERCLRLGTAFDVRWDLPGLTAEGYREVVRVREDGRVDLTANGRHSLLKSARKPERSTGGAPELTVEVARSPESAASTFTAHAQVTPGAASVYYTTGADQHGEYQNAMVLWELYGPGEADYRTLTGKVIARPATGRASVVETRFQLTKPGQYRLRAAACDLAGRSVVVWREIKIISQP